MVQDDAQGLALFEKLLNTTDRFLEVGLKYLGAVPFDQQLRKAVQNQQPIVTAYPRSPAAKSIQKIATKVLQWPVPDQATGYLQFFIERLLSASNSLNPRRQIPNECCFGLCQSPKTSAKRTDSAASGVGEANRSALVGATPEFC